MNEELSVFTEKKNFDLELCLIPCSAKKQKNILNAINNLHKST